MREILFRAIPIGKKKFIYGFYAKIGGKDVIIKAESENYWNEELKKSNGNEVVEIKLETVGQYTGLHDKNGKKIFEGDILKGYEYPFMDDDGDFNYFAEVCWFDELKAFGLFTLKNQKSDKVRGISAGNTELFENFDSNKWEVIGNVWDNADLIEGQ